MVTSSMPAPPRCFLPFSQASSQFFRLNPLSISEWTFFFPCLPSDACGFCGSTVIRTGVGAFTQGTFQPPSTSSPLASRVPLSAKHGAFPLRPTFGVRRRRCSWQRSKAFCCGLVPESYAPLRLLASRRPELRSRVYPRLPLGGFRPRFVFPVARPFVCGCHTISTIPTVWTILGLPGSPAPLPHRVVRTHRGAMGGNHASSPP
jgi:hypothetical protein